MPELESAVDRILSSNGDIATVLDQVSQVCRELRQQTMFDCGSGCVNDRMPSMVPLLPPEEIWCSAGELPLDVWRLLSFEIDVVSSAVALDTGVTDFAFSSNTPSALALRALLRHLGGRRVSFELRPKRFPAKWRTHLAKRRSIETSLARLYFEAGRLLTPLAVDDHTAWYAALRYLHWIDDASRELRVRDDFNRTSIDSRYRGVFAEETAVGLMAVIMSDVLGAAVIANTVEWIESSGLGPYPRAKPIADFIGEGIDPVSGAPITIVAESKGSLGKLVSADRRRRALSQLDQTHAFIRGAAQVLPVAFCSNIRFAGDTEATCCDAIDPPPTADEDEPISLDPVAGWRVAYTQALRLIGLERSAHEVREGAPAESLRSMDFDREIRQRRRDERIVAPMSDAHRQRVLRAEAAREQFGVELLLDAGDCAIAVDSRVFHILRRGIGTQEASILRAVAREPHPDLFRSSISDSAREAEEELSFATRQRQSFGASLGFAFIFYSDLIA